MEGHRARSSGRDNLSRASRADQRLAAMVDQLNALSDGDPGPATDYAIDLIAQRREHRVLEPALDFLLNHPTERARHPLRERFADLMDNGIRHDQDCALRERIARVLQEIGDLDDQDLAERGLHTIQLQPPARIDVAQGLRGRCLLWLSDLAPERANYYAVEMLSDPHRSIYSGEPTVTAIQVLAARGQILPIWALARRDGLPPDVLAQAFASLRKSPRDLQLEALRNHLARARGDGESGEAIALVSAEAIILNALTNGYAEVIDLILTTTNRNLCVYLVSTASRQVDATLQAHLHTARQSAFEPWRRAIFADALGPM